MKLITELTEDVTYISETKEDGTKNLYIEGIYLQSAIKNRNGRIYPEHIMDKEVARYLKETVDAGIAYGELNHPSGPQINGDRISHRIVSLRKEGTNYVGKAIVGDTDMGRNVKGIIEMGGKIGVSSRALGSLKTNSLGINEVQDDFRLVTAADVVTDPSAPQAWVNGIMEGCSYFLSEGTIIAVEEAKEEIEEAVRAHTLSDPETKLALFERYMNKLSKNF